MVVIAAIVVALLSAIPLYLFDTRQRRQRYARWHKAYYQEGGLVRLLIKRWRGGTAITDQRELKGGDR
jgi:hypothetical protein